MNNSQNCRVKIVVTFTKTYQERISAREAFLHSPNLILLTAQSTFERNVAQLLHKRDALALRDDYLAGTVVDEESK